MWKRYIKNVSLLIEYYFMRVCGVAHGEFVPEFANSIPRIQDGEWNFQKHLRVSGVADYEFIIRFTKFNMANPTWQMKFSKMTITSVQNVLLRVLEVAHYEFIVRFCYICIVFEETSVNLVVM